MTKEIPLLLDDKVLPDLSGLTLYVPETINFKRALRQLYFFTTTLALVLVIIAHNLQ